MNLTCNEIDEIEQLLYQGNIEDSRDDLLKYTKTTFKRFTPKDFHIKFYDILNLFAQKRIKNMIVSMPPQHGKLLPSNTPILTTKGWKQHGKLKRGDFVFGQDGKRKKVLFNTGIYDWNVEELIFNDGKSILASKEHLWSLEVEYDDHKGRRNAVLETQQIFQRKNRRRPYIKCSPSIEMNNRKLPIAPYILGCWLGDGHSRQGVLTVGEQDIKHFSKLGESREIKKGIYRVLIDGLSKKLRLNNLIKNKHIPIDYILSSKEQRLELLRGLMDTDGYVDKNRGNCEFTQMKGQLVEDVYVLLRSLGFKARLKYYDAKLNGNVVGVKGRIYFNPNKDDEIFKLQRKQTRLSTKKVADRNDKYKLFISKIQTSGVIKGNCIGVEGSMYLAGYDLIPTHNSEGSTRRLMSFIAGVRPDERMALVCYAATKAQKFGREIMTIIREQEYKDIFPDVKYPERGYTGQKANTNENRESINSIGSMKFVGVEGPLTGDSIDILFFDDLYKDWKEANSPLVQENVWDWYISVADSRLHNDSQQLITFTRWSDNDLIAKLISLKLVVVYDGSDDVDNVVSGLRDDQFLMINFQALKVGERTELDPRSAGEALWEEKHSKTKLESTRSKDPDKFECLHQGNPVNRKGLLYHKFKTYKDLPSLKIVKNYTDTADTGKDYLCSIVYGVPLSGTDSHKYVVDVLFSNEAMEVTEPLAVDLLNKNNVNIAKIESNNGGRGFARVLKAGVKRTNIVWFHQSNNKEARIFSQSASVNNEIVFPDDWHIRWADFYQHITTYKKIFKDNKFDDGADVLTGIIEEESKANTVYKTEVNANDLGLF